MIWLLLLAVLAACDGGGHGGGPTTKPTPQANFPIGAGLVQGWYNHPREVVDANADVGLTFTEIEWVSDQDLASCPSGSPRTDDYFGTDMRGAEDVVDEARHRGVTVFINIANANNCAVMAQNDNWFLDQLEQVLVLGYDHVLIQAVSEPWASPEKANRWANLARQKIQGDHLVGPGGFLEDIHYCNPTQLMNALMVGRPLEISNTDCSPILDPGPVTAAAFAKAAKGTKSPLMIYDNKSKDLSTLGATITAMGDAIK